MIRFALSVLALSAALATVSPAFADSAEATTVEHAQAAAAAPSVAVPAAGVGVEEKAAPSGLGWG